MYAQRRKSGVAVAALLGAAALTLTACGGSDASSAGPGGGSTGAAGDTSLSDMKTDLGSFADPVTDLPDVAPVPGVSSLAGKTVWWVPLGPQLDASFGDTIRKGLEALDINVQTCDGKFLPTTVASCLEQAGNQGADAVLTGYVDYKTLPTAFDALAAKGIPVLLAGAVNNSGKEQSAEFAFADTTEIAERAARTQLEAAITDTQGTGHLMWAALEDSEQLKAVTSYASGYVKDNCPDCTFKVITTNSAALTKLTSQAGAALASNPDTNYVIAQADPMVPPILTAIQTAGLQSKIKVIGAGPLPDTLLTLQGGNSPLVAITGVSLSYEAWSFTDSLVRMMTGEVPPEQVQTLYRLFTPENSTSLDATPEALSTATWFADDDAVAASFTSAWGVS